MLRLFKYTINDGFGEKKGVLQYGQEKLIELEQGYIKISIEPTYDDVISRSKEGNNDSEPITEN